LLEKIKSNGELIVVTRNSQTSYYEGADGPAGIEYELAKMFANELGVKLKLIVPESLNDILDDLNKGLAQIAAAGLTVTRERKKQFWFGPAYQKVTEQLIYNTDHRRPGSLSSLHGQLEVVANSSHADRLHHLKKMIPELSWKADKNTDTEELLQLVSDGMIDYTIADSNQVALDQRYLLNIRVAFDITKPEPLAWALQKSTDKSLLFAVQNFFQKIKRMVSLPV